MGTSRGKQTSSNGASVGSKVTETGKDKDLPKNQKPSPSKYNKFKVNRSESASAQNDVIMGMSFTGDLFFFCINRRSGLPPYLRYHTDCFENTAEGCAMIEHPKVGIHGFGTERDLPPAYPYSKKKYINPRTAYNEKISFQTIFIRYKVKEGEFDDPTVRSNIHQNFTTVLNFFGKHKNDKHQYPQTFRVGEDRTNFSRPSVGKLLDPDTIATSLFHARFTEGVNMDDPAAVAEAITSLKSNHDAVYPYFDDASYAQFLQSFNLPVGSSYAQALALSQSNNEDNSSSLLQSSDHDHGAVDETMSSFL